MKTGDSVWIVVLNYPDKIHVTPHAEREGAYAEVNHQISSLACGCFANFADPGPDNPEDRLEA